jgi:hypothetical protein
MSVVTAETESTQEPRDAVDMYPFGKTEFEITPENVDILNQGLEALEPQVRKTAEVSKRIGDILKNPDHQLSKLDRQKLEAMQTRIEIGVMQAAWNCAEKMNRFHFDKAQDLPNFHGFNVTLIDEIGEEGGYIRNGVKAVGSDVAWVPGHEAASRVIDEFKGVGRVDELRRAEFDLGKTSNQTKTELYKALGVLKDGETTIEQAVQRRKKEIHRPFWNQEYDASLDTDIEGVSIEVYYRSKQRSRGMNGQENFATILHVEV